MKDTCPCKIVLALEGVLGVFCWGGLVDTNSFRPVLVALSSVEAEYLSWCNLGAMISHLRELVY